MLFDYQQDMLLRVINHLYVDYRLHLLSHGSPVGQLGASVMVQMPTGTGKTHVMASVVDFVLRRLKALPKELRQEIWVVAHRRELVVQTEETLDRFGIPHVRNDEALKADGVRVMSIQWLSLNHGRLCGEPFLIVIDEAHHSLAHTWRAMWTRYPQALKLGLTATPCRLNRQGFRPLYNHLLTSLSIDEFIAQGRLALYDYVVINRNSDDQAAIDGLSRRGADGDYSVVEMDGVLNKAPAVERLYKSLSQYAPGKRGIVYAINIAHARRIATYYSSEGLRAVAIDGKTPAKERRQVVDDFRAGKIDCLVNVNLFDEGFDCPDIQYIQLARPTLSLAKYMQMIGRGLRVHPGKEMCVIIDNVGLYRTFGKPDDRRDWQAMFDGRKAGKAVPTRPSEGLHAVKNNEMELVVNHSLSAAYSAREAYLQAAEPFEQDGRWGIRVNDDIILRPIYRMITPFVGQFAAFSIAPDRWGILTRAGRWYLSPAYKRVEISPDNRATVERNGALRYVFSLNDGVPEVVRAGER